jgi:glycerol-3-phosphate dehydrogenase (NAD(P)+)
MKQVDTSTPKVYWRGAKIAVLGGGSWGTVLANLAAQNVLDVRLWARDEEQVRAINATRENADYLPEMKLHEKVHAYSDLERVFEGGVQAVIWALPSAVCREQAKVMAKRFAGDEMLIHATKGIEEGTMKRISEILREEIPCPRIGVISGPNLATEVARGEPAATVVASSFDEVIEAGMHILMTEKFRVYSGQDVIGVEWAGTLKNILAIASGALDAMKLGWNTRALMITRGAAEMVRFGTAMGAKETTFLGLAGIGDLLATCSSPLSRNYRVGMRLAQGEKLEKVLAELGSTAEGVRTTRSVWKFAQSNRIYMPITEAVYHLLEEGTPVQQVLQNLMSKPAMSDSI